MLVAGVDEAGRGPLAGPVVAAAVVLSATGNIPYLNDSKKLSAKQREIAFAAIVKSAIAIGVGQANRAEIDEINILHASMLAMKRAVDDLSVRPDTVLCDGNRCPVLDVPASAVVRGDATVACISAASIIAKVTRDRMMFELHLKHPSYGFDRHKGYPTKAHKIALETFGPTTEHRRSFGPVRRYLLAQEI
ncbi:MAG: ribonuclease HII [Gammaproteobacteria bacterium]|jgi:ribonuclease HII